MDNLDPAPPPPLDEAPYPRGTSGSSPEAPLEEPSQQGDPKEDLERLRLRRTPLGWILLFLIFALLIVNAVAGSLGPKAAGKASVATEEATLKMSVMQRQLGKLAKSPVATEKIKTGLVDEVITPLEKRRAKEPEAARLYVAAKYEAGMEIDPKDLDTLNNSTSREDRAIAQIYGNEKLTANQARSLTNQLKGNEFVARLARAVAGEKSGNSGLRDRLNPPGKIVGIFLFIAGMIGLGIIGTLLWVVYYALRGNRQISVLGHPAEPITKAEADRFAFRGFLLMLSFLVVAQVLPVLLSPLSGLGPARNFITYGVMLLMVVVIHRFPALGLSIPLSRIGVKGGRLAKDIGWGVLGYLASLPILAINLAIASVLIRQFGPPSHPATELLATNPSTLTVLAIFFAASIVAPFWEEIMFRGTLLPAFSTVTGRPLWGILISSFLFAALHPQGITLWIALGSIGAMSSLLAYQTKSLVPSIVLHMIHNTVILTMGLLVL